MDMISKASIDALALNLEEGSDLPRRMWRDLDIVAYARGNPQYRVRSFSIDHWSLIHRPQERGGSGLHYGQNSAGAKR
jgi:hypothetical protein